MEFVLVLQIERASTWSSPVYDEPTNASSNAFSGFPMIAPKHTYHTRHNATPKEMSGALRAGLAKLTELMGIWIETANRAETERAHTSPCIGILLE